MAINGALGAVIGDEGSSYRHALADLNAAATPAPWISQGELYGVAVNGHFRPLGFAPHHQLDAVLIAAYRNGARDILAALSAVERHLRHASVDDGYSVAAAIVQVVSLLDAETIDGEETTAYLRRLDKSTTQPLWDWGHLAMAMDILEYVDDVQRLPPQPADPLLIAAVRTAIPRALDVLGLIAGLAVTQCDGNGSLAADVVAAALTKIAEFDRYRVDEGAGTGAV